jgi:hypothetical protein
MIPADVLREFAKLDLAVPGLGTTLLRIRQEAEQNRERNRHRCHVILTCPDCGKVERRGHAAKRCSECQAKHDRERRTLAARRRRAMASGRCRIKSNQFFSVLIPVQLRCQHCGKAFTPKRSTARYCSDLCRVRAHRSKVE